MTLLESREFGLLGVTRLGEAIKASGMKWFHFPIPDLDVPSEDGMEEWRKISPKLHRILERGGRVLVHCRGGLGRAGTIAALLLTERGHSAEQAMRLVRSKRPGAIENVTQERWLHEHALQFTLKENQIRGCLLGGAIGDSFGSNIEFLSLNEIQRRHPGGILDLPKHDGVRGAITDDTQMTLFTAEGIIRAHIRGSLKGMAHPPSVVHHALLRWYKTQGGKPSVETDKIGLVKDRRLWRKRAPGNTCLSSLAQSGHFGDVAKNNSKGCGSIMRAAPWAVMDINSLWREYVLDASALTHGHITGKLAAAAWTEMIYAVADGKDLETVASDTAERYKRIEHGRETEEAIWKALKAPRDGRPETVEALGGGWIAEEALSIALYACLVAQSFVEAIAIAITHSGDSDSTAAIAGNMYGVMYPEEVIHSRWSFDVEAADIINRLTKDYLTLMAGNRLKDGGEELCLKYFKHYPGI